METGLYVAHVEDGSRVTSVHIDQERVEQERLNIRAARNADRMARLRAAQRAAEANRIQKETAAAKSAERKKKRFAAQELSLCVISVLSAFFARLEMMDPWLALGICGVCLAVGAFNLGRGLRGRRNG